MDVPLVELARRLGVHTTVARKFALKLGMVPTRKQIADLGHRQRTLTWTEEEADAIVAERRRGGSRVPAR